ncbi:MAG: radical SAM protein, partial [bacterium]
WWDSKNDDSFHVQKFEDLIHSRSILNGHVKILPSLRLGEEIRRSRGYHPEERLTEACVENYDFRNLQCATCRMVTNKGVYVCPILLDFPEARMGDGLEETFRPFPLTFQACYTCRIAGLCCGDSA